MNKELKKEIFFKKGRIRKKVFDSLTKPKTATEVARELKLHRSSVSRILLNLEKEGFVKCINPEDKSFRHYSK